MTNVWIVEWLPPDEQRTGRLLHEWMKDRRPGWSAYSMCNSKHEVLAAIERATNRAQQSGMIPALHLEAHGNDLGLEGPNGSGGTEFLSWEELTEPLQRLNLMTRCNLIVVVAACTGFAGIKALVRGPRSPAVALVGPDAPVLPSSLLSGTKEFYRRWRDENPNLGEIVASASEQAGKVTFELEPFVILAYEAMVEQLIVSIRSNEQRLRIVRIRDDLQRVWDEMFMIDLYPENRERFGVDMPAIVEIIVSS